MPSFNPPNMNISVNVWRGSTPGIPPAGPPALTLAGQLRMLKSAFAESAIDSVNLPMILIVPKGADVRGPVFGGRSDTVEVPALSGRFYSVMGVDDVARGFANEHRLCVIVQSVSPTPIP